jgi:hypothetical protein
MITLTKLANYFEEGLNKTLNNPEIQFKIWADAGKFQKPVRDGNSITYYVNGNLKTSTSANDANDLVMGVNGLSLEFAIPIQQPRTNATQTAEELAKIKNEQYPFIAYITSAVNKFFSTAQVASLNDDDATEFSISWLAGTAVTGDVDMRPVVGDSILFTVYIEITFVAGGVSSRLVKVYIDDSPVPIKAIRHGRSPMLERDVYAAKLTSKNVATSTAFSIDVEFPANKDTATKVCLDYLFKGEPNVAHFVNVKFGDVQEQLYLMTLNTVQTAVQGISIVGITASLIEVTENILAINVPDGFQVGKFTFATSDAESLTFTPSEDCLAYVAGQAVKLTGGNAQTILLDPSSMQCNFENGTYEVYLITNKAVSISSASATYENIITGA